MPGDVTLGLPSGCVTQSVQQSHCVASAHQRQPALAVSVARYCSLKNVCDVYPVLLHLSPSILTTASWVRTAISSIFQMRKIETQA